MASTIKLRRSATSGAIPTTSQLALGELAMNTYDGKLFLKTNQSGTEAIVQVGGGGNISISSSPPNIADSDIGDVYWDSDEGNPYILYNDGDTTQWVSLVATAAGSGGSGGTVISENEQVINSSYTLTTGSNGHSVGPVTISSGVSVTVPANATWMVS